MPEFKRHLIIYSSENQPIAEQLAETLQEADKEAVILERSATDMSEQVGHISIPDDSSVVFLVTDNFLKSYGCMNGILQMAHKWGDEDLLNTVVTEGTIINEDGEQEAVPTNFERVGNIIQYMNYWQDKYLALRKEKRTREMDEELDEQIAITKEISADIGEFLRYIRGKGIYGLEEFKQKFGVPATDENSGSELPDGASILKSNSVVDDQEPTQSGEHSLVEMIENSSEELLAENPDMPREEMADINKESKELGETPSQAPLEGLIEEAAGKEEEVPEYDPFEEDIESSPSDFSQKELEALNAENDELMSILDEVLQEEGVSENVNNEDFVGDDPDNPGDFNIDSLLDENGNKANTPSIGLENQEDIPVGDNEVLLNIEEGNNESISSEEILERAVDYFGDNQIQEGITFMKEAVEKKPSDTTLRYYHAYALARYAADYQAAKTQLEILLKQDNEHPDAWFLMAELAENQQEYEEAKKCFEKVIEIQPSYPEAHYRLGILLADYLPGTEEEAAVHLKIAIQHDEENTDAYYMLAILLSEKLDQPENSVKHFRKVVKLQPDHPFANYDLALIYHLLGDKTRAVEFYGRAIAVNPELKTEQNDIAFGVNVLEEEEVVETGQNETIDQETPSNTDMPDAPAIELATGDEPPESVAIAPASDVEIKKEPEELEEKEEESENGLLPKTALSEENRLVIKTKTILITGGTAGIGKATAEIFARNGHRVIITGRRQKRLNEISETLSEKYQAPIQTLAFDVRDQEAVKAVFDNLPEEWKNVDILINNAGLSKGLDPIHEGNMEDWDTMIDTNVKGLLYITKAISPGMVERKNGHIINVSSIAGTEVYPGGNVYSASKAAVSSLTRSMRLDLHKYNIRVSQVSPGHVEETEFARVRFDWDTEKASKVYEDFQPLKSSDVAETIYFIATRPPHVNIQDIYMYGTQQASATMIERSGR